MSGQPPSIPNGIPDRPASWPPREPPAASTHDPHGQGHVPPPTSAGPDPEPRSAPHSPLSPPTWWNAPSTRPKRRTLPIVFGGVAFSVALALVLAFAPSVLRHKELASQPTPSEAASSMPTSLEPTPAGASFPKYNGSGATDNVLYNIGWNRDAALATCPTLTRNAPQHDDASTKNSLTVIIHCLVSLNAPALAEYEIDVPTPKIVFYKNSAETACARITDGEIGSLCTSDQTLYFSLNAARSAPGYADNPLGLYWIASHEFGHWLQYQTGILNRVGDTLVESRRVELQANCMAGMFLNAVWTQAGGNAAVLQTMTRSFRSIYGDEIPGEGTHGSPASATKWFDKGFANGGRSSYAACNTFVASASDVD